MSAHAAGSADSAERMTGEFRYQKHDCYSIYFHLFHSKSIPFVFDVSWINVDRVGANNVMASICGVCQTQPSKYKCPKCDLP